MLLARFKTSPWGPPAAAFVILMALKLGVTSFLQSLQEMGTPLVLDLIIGTLLGMGVFFSAYYLGKYIVLALPRLAPAERWPRLMPWVAKFSPLIAFFSWMPFLGESLAAFMGASGTAWRPSLPYLIAGRLVFCLVLVYPLYIVGRF